MRGWWTWPIDLKVCQYFISWSNKPRYIDRLKPLALYVSHYQLLIVFNFYFLSDIVNYHEIKTKTKEIYPLYSMEGVGVCTISTYHTIRTSMITVMFWWHTLYFYVHLYYYKYENVVCLSVCLFVKTHFSAI